MDIYSIIQAVVVLAIVLFCGLVLFALLRGVALWYWRVNEIADTLREIRDELVRQGKREPSA